MVKTPSRTKPIKQSVHVPQSTKAVQQKTNKSVNKQQELTQAQKDEAEKQIREVWNGLKDSLTR